MANLKERIIELMEENNIKSSLNTISKWDKVQPSAENLSKVAKILGVSPNYLLYGEQSEAEKEYNEAARKMPTAIAIGDNEVLLLETFRKLSNDGKLRVLAKISEEYDKEYAEPSREDISSTSRVG